MQIWKLLSLRDGEKNCIKTLTLPKLHGVKRALGALLALQLDPWCCVRLGENVININNINNFVLSV